MARLYRQPSPVAASSSTDWSDAGIGAAAGAVLLACGGVAVFFAQRSRCTKLAL